MAVTIKEMVDQIIHLSTQAAGSQLSKQDKLYITLIEQSNKLVTAYDDYEGRMAEYNKWVKENAKIKRQINKYKNNTDVVNDLSAQLATIREKQYEMRKIDGFLTQVQVSLTNIYKMVFQLQRTVNRISGQSIQMVYTSMRHGKLVTVELHAKDFDNGMYTLDIDRYGKMILRYDTAEIERVVQDIQDTQRNNRIITSSLQPKLEALYHEILERQNIARDKGGAYLLWQIGKEWNKIKFIAIGDLIEAYTNALINSAFDENTRKELEELFKGNLDQQIDYMVRHYVTQVTNKSGFFEEDVQVGNTNQFYGVKSAGASLMGLTLIVNLAKMIVLAQQGIDISMTQIKKLQKAFDRSTGRNKITTLMEDEITQEMDDLMKEFNQKLTK